MLVLARANLEGVQLIHRDRTGRSIAGYRCYSFLGLKSSTNIFEVLLVYLLRLVNNLLEPRLRSGLFNYTWNNISNQYRKTVRVPSVL